MLAQTAWFAPAFFLLTREERNQRRKSFHLSVRNDIIRKPIQFTPSPHGLGHLVSSANENGGHIKELLYSNPAPAALANQLLNLFPLLLLLSEHWRDHHVQFKFAEPFPCCLAHPDNFLHHRCR